MEKTKLKVQGYSIPTVLGSEAANVKGEWTHGTYTTDGYNFDYDVLQIGQGEILLTIANNSGVTNVEWQSLKTSKNFNFCMNDEATKIGGQPNSESCQNVFEAISYTFDSYEAAKNFADKLIENLPLFGEMENATADVEEMAAVVIGSIDEELDGSQEDDEETALNAAAIPFDEDDDEDDELVDEPEETADVLKGTSEPHTYHVLAMNAKGRLTFDGKIISRKNASNEVRSAHNWKHKGENYQDINAVLLTDEYASNYLSRGSDFYSPAFEIGNVKWVDFGRDEIPYINQKVMDIVSWYQAQAREADEEKANNLVAQLDECNSHLEELTRSLNLQYENFYSQHNMIIAAYRTIAFCENYIWDVGLEIDAINAEIEKMQKTKKTITDQIITKRAFQAINQAAASIEDDGSNDEPDEESILDTAVNTFDMDDADDELVDDPETDNAAATVDEKFEIVNLIRGEKNCTVAFQSHHAKFKVGGLYLGSAIEKFGAIVKKRTAKNITFDLLNLDTDEIISKDARKKISFDSEGSECINLDSISVGYAIEFKYSYTVFAAAKVLYYDVDVSEYAVTAEAQDAAIEGEIHNAKIEVIRDTIDTVFDECFKKAADVEEIAAVVIGSIDEELDGSQEDDEESALDVEGFYSDDDNELTDAYGIWKERVTPYTYHALILDRKGKLTFDGQHISKEKAVTEIELALSERKGRAWWCSAETYTYKHNHAILLADDSVAKYINYNKYRIQCATRGNMKMVDFGRDVIPYINQKVADLISWYQAQAREADEEKAQELAYQNSLEYKRDCWDEKIADLKSELEFFQGRMLSFQKTILYELRVIADLEDKIWDVNFTIEDFKKSISFCQAARGMVALEIEKRDIHNTLNAAAAGMEDDGSNDEPDEESEFDTAAIPFDEDEDEDDELIDEPDYSPDEETEFDNAAATTAQKYVAIWELNYHPVKSYFDTVEEAFKYLWKKHLTEKSSHSWEISILNPQGEEIFLQGSHINDGMPQIKDESIRPLYEIGQIELRAASAMFSCKSILSIFHTRPEAFQKRLEAGRAKRLESTINAAKEFANKLRQVVSEVEAIEESAVTAEAQDVATQAEIDNAEVRNRTKGRGFGSGKKYATEGKHRQTSFETGKRYFSTTSTFGVIVKSRTVKTITFDLFNLNTGKIICKDVRRKIAIDEGKFECSECVDVSAKPHSELTKMTYPVSSSNIVRDKKIIAEGNGEVQK